MTPEQKKAYDLKKWQWCVKHIERLIELDAPAQIKAQMVVSIMIPKIIRTLNIADEMGKALGEMFARGIGHQSVMCSCCHKVPMYVDDVEDTCPKCTSIMDQYEAMCEPSQEEKLLDAIFNSDPDNSPEKEDE